AILRFRALVRSRENHSTGNSGVESVLIRPDAYRKRLRARASPAFVPMGLLAALGVRLAWAVIYPAKPVSDFHWYYEVGREIADGRGIAYLGHATAIRPPGYPLLVAFANVLSGNRLLADRLLTVALGVGAVWLAYLIARIAFSSELAGRVTVV